MNSQIPAGDCLNIGSGPHVEAGWISIDGSWQARLAGRPMLARVAGAMTSRAVGHWPAGIVCRDVRAGLARAPSTVAVIYSSHFLEHLRRDEALRFLVECRSVLKTGGVCRVVTPDLHALASRYVQAASSDRLAGDRFIAASLLTHAAHAPAGPLAWYRQRTQFDAHKWLYDESTLCTLFEDAGFADPRPRRYLESAIPQDLLTRVERRERIENGEGIVVEAVV